MNDWLAGCLAQPFKNYIHWWIIDLQVTGLAIRYLIFMDECLTCRVTGSAIRYSIFRDEWLTCRVTGSAIRYSIFRDKWLTCRVTGSAIRYSILFILMTLKNYVSSYQRLTHRLQVGYLTSRVSNNYLLNRFTFY